MADETTSTETSQTTTSEATALTGEVVDTSATETTGTETAETTALNAVEKTAEQIAADEAAAKAAAVPEAYELAAPEGFTLDAAAIELATPVFKDLGLNNEQANKLMPVAAQFAQGLIDKQNAQILTQVAADRKAWLDTAKADPEIGGQHWDATLKTAASALDQLGFTKGSPFRVLLDESGLGNHPDMIRAFQKVGKAIGEDGFVRTGNGMNQKRPMEERWYDKPKGGE